MLVLIDVLKRSCTPLSRSTMSDSNTCNCSSWHLHTNFFFWNALKTRDHPVAQLGITLSASTRNATST
ncbi:hypothetical protein BRADI_4g05074v3 [Brachypodium distachyon]|uniref:Uncharacterized protein n=1 Tax=Brachypodium distachyon TaxID=15368 RepID=A0A2K2CKL1_BRADI|nr:hypothetical protein BRADI_4g05074v3 [Brachypodium distachyon]